LGEFVVIDRQLLKDGFQSVEGITLNSLDSIVVQDQFLNAQVPESVGADLNM
jgi:hypothetical protein